MTTTDRTERVEPAPPPRPAAPWRRLVLLALMCLVLGGLGGVLAATASRPEPVPARFVPPREVAFDFTLRDQDGKQMRLADSRGKVIAMTFVYTSCRDLCPAEGNDISSAIQMVGGKGVVAYIVSVDPENDTQKRIQDWVKRRGLDGGLGHYLVGSRDALRPVWAHYGIAPIEASGSEAQAAAAGADQFRAANPPPEGTPWPFKYEAPPEPTTPAPKGSDEYPDPTQDLAYRGRARHIQGWDFEHSAYVLLIDKRGVQRIGIPFEQLDPKSLAHDMRILIAES